MPIAQNSVVTIHYTLKDDAGEVIDSSRDGDPIAYLHGHGNLVPGLERELEGKNTRRQGERERHARSRATASTTRASFSRCRAGRYRALPT